jgi:hypothetical protein
MAWPRRRSGTRPPSSGVRGHGRHAAVTEAVRPARRIGAQIVQGEPRSFVVAASRHSRLPGVWTRAHRMARVLHIPAGTGERPPR